MKYNELKKVLTVGTIVNLKRGSVLLYEGYVVKSPCLEDEVESVHMGANCCYITLISPH